ncbi:ALBINO3-like protein 2, chloroplastic [Bidens hawaiensis]|uniref:ALBINO3-like protein 2, chloroplastic n=1 Tax=Bidens hawaiensis TaxID=980011 RepID=UPI00404B71F9
MGMRKQSVSKLVLRLRHHSQSSSSSSSSPSPSPVGVIMTSTSSIPIQSQPNRFNRFLRRPYYNYNYNLSYSSRFFFSTETGSDSATVSSAIDDPILPVRCLVTALDTLHNLTGIPWWMTIIISSVALRVTILPVLLLQLRNLKRNAELVSLLPSPIPPPFSGKSWVQHYRCFRDKRKQIGCPSFLWILAYPLVQIPCFILGTVSVRQMALDHHPGFDCGGTLWFQNLIELPHGMTGCIFPLLIASLHLVNVRVSLDKSSLARLPNLIGVLAKYYKYYLHCLTIPILFAGFYLPQGSLLYWTANSSLTLVQQLTMKHPHVREKLGLPDKLAPENSGKSPEMDGLESIFTVPLVKKRIQELSVLEIYNLSILHLSKGEKDRAVPLLRLILEKDPEHVSALITMGQILMNDQKVVEATEYLDRAMTKLLRFGHPTELEDINNLIVASNSFGRALGRQGKVAEAIVHLERIANMKEPEDAKTKLHYCEGLLALSSAYLVVGRNADAEKYLRILTTIDPAYGEYLKHIESEAEDNNFASDLENSRRKDY